MSKAVGVLVLACAVAGAAHAEPGGTSSVSGVSITEGVLKLEARTAVFNGGAIDGDWAHRVQASYNFTDWWRTQLNVRATQPDGEDIDLRNIGWENAVDFTATRDWPVRLGGQFEYRFGIDEVPDSVEFKLLAERRTEHLNVRANLIAGRNVGEDTSGEWTHGYSVRAMYALNDMVQIGGEGFGELDIDAHAWGPRAGFTIGHTALSAGYFVDFGDDADADSQLRFTLEFTP
jgi:hypothetical protein